MNILTDLRAALAAKEEVVVGEATFDARYRPLPRKNAALKECRHDRLHALLTNDTIRALLDVAEAAEAKAYCPFCDVTLHVETARSTPHMPYCPLAPLVKEATNE